MNDIINSSYFTYIVIPLLICLARIMDVTLGTLRIILVSKGDKKIAPILGFFEVFIWLLAIGQVMNNLTNIVNYFAYALGFAIGNFIGILIEQKLAMGMVVVQVITRKDASDLINFLRVSDLGVTVVDAAGATGPVQIIFTVTKRSYLPYVLTNIQHFNPNAFYSVEDIRHASGMIFPNNTSWLKRKFSDLLGTRKAK